MNKFQPIQIIGTQRSGSNMLRLMLNQVDEISAPHPPHILQRFFPLLPQYGDLEIQENFELLVDDVCTLVERNPVPWTGINLSRTEIANLCQENTLIEIFRVLYEIKAEKDGAMYWVCKSMANIDFVNELERSIHPKYIHLYRDGRDVACSFKKAVVGEKHVYHIANQWKEDQEKCLELGNKIGAERILKIKYEDLLSNPEKELKRIGTFLNIEIPGKVFDFYKSEESQKTAIAGKMWENVSKPILKMNSNKYKKELTQIEIAIFEKQASATLTKLGYVCENSGLINGRSFTAMELEAFDHENKRLKKQALALADPEGMKLRQHQERFLYQIQQKGLYI